MMMEPRFSGLSERDEFHFGNNVCLFKQEAEQVQAVAGDHLQDDLIRLWTAWESLVSHCLLPGSENKESLHMAFDDVCASFPCFTGGDKAVNAIRRASQHHTGTTKTRACLLLYAVVAPMRHSDSGPEQVDAVQVWVTTALDTGVGKLCPMSTILMWWLANCSSNAALTAAATQFMPINGSGMSPFSVVYLVQWFLSTSGLFSSPR
jgi:hypothetical protein